jgi:Tfp pilus assembly protein PilF
MNNEEKRSRRSLEYFQKGYALQLKGHLDKAADYFKKSLQYKESAEAYTYLGWIHGQKGFYQKAIEDCLKAVEVNPDFGNPYNDIGVYLIHLKRYNEAFDWLKKALMAPKYDNYCYPLLNLGHICEIKGDWDNAIDYYKRSIRENPDYLSAQTALERLEGKFN